MPWSTKPETRAPERIALAYLLCGAAWIYFSDLAEGGANSGAFPAGIQTLKGWLFVLATGGLLYFLLVRFFARLKKSQQDLRMTQFVTDNAGEAVLWIEPAGVFRYVNRAACSSLGHRESQLLALTVFDIDHDLTPEQWTNMWLDLKEHGFLRMERTHVRRDGTQFPVEITTNYVQFGEDVVACAFIRDISDRRGMEKALRESEERLRRAMVEAPFPVMLHAEDGSILLLSHMWTERSGYTAEDIPTVEEWLARSGAGTWTAMKEKYRLAARFDEGTVQIRAKNGTMREWELQSSPLGALPDGRRMLLTMALDSTERSALMRQFMQAQKMEAVGRLAAGIAHDFNNLLTLIIGYGQLLARRPGSEKVPSYAAEIVRAGERASGLTHQLLAFTRQQMVDPVLIELNPEIRSLEKMLRRIIGEDVELILDLSPDTGHVLMDPTQLGQLVMNLTVNARDAMPKGGALRIATRRAMLPDGREPLEVSDLPAGQYVVLYFTDTGTGIPPEVLARIFEPFFTTKEHGKGTGLGLPTVHGIVEMARGKLTVESSLGEGTTFAVWLPVAEAPAEVPEALRQGEASPPIHACIAVVEDDPGVRAFVTEVLRSGNYIVIEAGEPQEALALLGMYRGSVDLLLTDVIMPGMNGFDFAMKLRAERPGLRIVFMSGYAETSSGAELLEQGAVLLRKPFLADDLLHTISNALHQPAQ